MKVCSCDGNIKGCVLTSYIFLGYKCSPTGFWEITCKREKKSVKISFKYILGKKTAMKSVQLLNDKSITKSLRNDSAIIEKS